MRVVARTLVLSSVLLAAGGCSGCGPRPALPRDAGLDAPASDARLDAPASDARLDAPASDAAMAGDGLSPACLPEDVIAPPLECPLVDTDDVRWRKLSCMPNACRMLIARYPSEEVGPLQWRPCTSGRAGCRELVFDWSTDLARDRVMYQPGVVVNGMPWMWLSRLKEDFAGPYWQALIPADRDGAVFVMKTNSPLSEQSCQAGYAALNAVDRVAGAGIHRFADLERNVVFLGNLDGSGWDRPRLVIDQPGCPIGATEQELTVARDRLAMVLTLPGIALARIDPSRHRLRTVDTDGMLPLRPRFFGDALFFQRDRRGQPLDVAVEVAGRPPVRLLGSPELNDAGRPARDVNYFLTDGETMVWIEGEDRVENPWSYQAVSLWTAPLATDPAAVHARRVGALPESPVGGNAAYGFGRYVYLESRTALRIVNLADGTFWRVESDPDLEWYSKGPAWVGPEEFAIGQRRRLDSPNGALCTIQRIRFDALGVPEQLPP